MLILRLLFWGLILLLLLPTSREEKLALYGAASRTAQDVASFCTRNPEVCEQAKVTFHSLFQKVKLGAEIIQDLVNKPAKPDNQQPQPSDASYPKSYGQESDVDEAVYKPQNTLNAEDLRPEWRGPSPRT